MQQTVENYWMFGAVCLVIALVLVRLLFRERITLQGSMSFLGFLTVLGLMAAFPQTTDRISKALGFTLMSNFFFCAAIAALAILHLRALVTLSRVHVRSIVLTQELAILQEKIDRLETRAARDSSGTQASSSPA
jgi:hypothetical protein